jgi:hypothetical protein
MQGFLLTMREKRIYLPKHFYWISHSKPLTQAPSPASGLSFFKPLLLQKSLPLLWTRFRIEVHAYALFANRYELLVRINECNLEKAMKHLYQVYQQRLSFRERGERLSYDCVLVQQEFVKEVLTYIDQLEPLEALSSQKYYSGLAPVPEWIFMSERRKQRALPLQVIDLNDRALRQARRLKILGSQNFVRALSIQSLHEKDRAIAV